MPKKPISREAMEDLLKRIADGEQLFASGGVTPDQLEIWSEECEQCLIDCYGSSNRYTSLFWDNGRPARIAMYSNPAIEARERMEDLKRRIEFLKQLAPKLEERATSAVVPKEYDEFWPILHPAVVTVAKSRFDTEHYADAAESAVKEFNSKIKEIVKRETGKELDGVPLMNQAFSPTSPIIKVADITTESGKNEQQGYMQIATGAISAIRNPKAHSNLKITRERAIHHLFVVSLLFSKLDERMP